MIIIKSQVDLGLELSAASAHEAPVAVHSIQRDSQLSTTLPKFNKPPVIEVSLSVQFQALQEYSVVHLGLLWQQFRSRFPKTEQHSSLPHTVERRGARNISQHPQFSISSADVVETPRLWMISDSLCELIQVQPDRFIRNWRGYHDKSAKYPSYDSQIRSAFRSDYVEFCSFVEEQGWGKLVVDQCEVTYVNHILGNDVWQQHSHASRVFKVWADHYPSLGGSEPEVVSARVRHELSDEEGKFLGRLYVDFDSGFLKSQGEPPLFLMKLMARGQPFGDGVDGVMGFLDFGHETIVKSFAELTTARMHEAWERTQ